MLFAPPAFAQETSEAAGQAGGVQPLGGGSLTVTNYSKCAGAVGTYIYVYGSQFGSTQGTVKFNGTTAPVQSWTDTQIYTSVPSGATTGAIQVTASGGGFGWGPSFLVATPSISPTSGIVGTAVAASNTCFTANSVKFNGTTATYSQNGYTVNTTVPSGATTGQLVISGTLMGYNYSNSFTFTVNTPAPSITSASPNPTTVGTSVTIGGSNFGSTRGTSTVTFNGVAATSYGTWGPTSVQATVPTAATTGPLVVTVGGVASNNWTFTVSPRITSLSVTTGPRGTAFTITGSGFGSTKGSSTVTVGGATATTTSWGASSIATSVPNGAPIGSDSVIVTVNGAASNSSTFTVTKSNTSTALVSDLNPSVYGSQVNFTATVTPVTATGTITFKDGSTTIGTGTLNGGVGTLQISWLSVATHTITAVYGGDSSNNGSTSAAVSQVVNAPNVSVPAYCQH